MLLTPSMPPQALIGAYGNSVIIPPPSQCLPTISAEMPAIVGGLWPPPLRVVPRIVQRTRPRPFRAAFDLPALSVEYVTPLQRALEMVSFVHSEYFGKPNVDFAGQLRRAWQVVDSGKVEPDIRITVEIPACWPEYVQPLCDALTVIDTLILKKNPRLPWLYDANLRYERDLAEIWQPTLALLRRKAGDCEDINCARAAELQVKAGEPARAIALETSDAKVLHIGCQRANGALDDACIPLGMMEV